MPRAVLDLKTSEICQDLDGKVFDMKDRAIGSTAPPFHVNCRTTTVPYDPEDDGERAARVEDGKTYYVPGNMTYKEWYEKYVGGDLPNRRKNRYDEYKNILGKNMPSKAEYDKTRYDADNKLIGVTAKNGTTITKNSRHSIARMIGSVEQRRNGFPVDEVLSVITSENTEVLPVKYSKDSKS